MQEKFITKNEKETLEIAKNFAKNLKDGDIVLLSGDLGAGKTLFTKGIVCSFGGDINQVVSPTFTIMNNYDDVNHFDLYRLNSAMEFEATGANEELYGDAISVVEWPEIVGFEYFPSYAYVVKILKKDETTREIIIGRND